MNNGFDMATKEVHSSVLILVDIWVTSSLQILHDIYINSTCKFNQVGSINYIE